MKIKFINVGPKKLSWEAFSPFNYLSQNWMYNQLKIRRATSAIKILFDSGCIWINGKEQGKYELIIPGNKQESILQKVDALNECNSRVQVLLENYKKTQNEQAKYQNLTEIDVILGELVEILDTVEIELDDTEIAQKKR